MDALDPSLFIGSSKEALEVARALQAELDGDCEPTVWDQGVFSPGNATLTDLYDRASRSDFAALVLTPDDVVRSRGRQVEAARDNVVFELGLFMGALGPRRVFIVRPRNQRLWLPTDLAGITTCEYNARRRDGDVRAAIGVAAGTIRRRIKEYGLREDRRMEETANPIPDSFSRRGLSLKEERAELNRELDAIERAVRAQKWEVRTRSSTAFRVVGPGGQRFTFPIGSPGETRDRLRRYAAQLKTAGLRVSQSVLAPVGADLEAWRTSNSRRVKPE